MAKRLTEEAVNILETYINEDELISELYENDIVGEEDILRLHEALSLLDEWDELLSEASDDDKGILRKIGAKASGFGLQVKDKAGKAWSGQWGKQGKRIGLKKWGGRSALAGVPAVGAVVGYKALKRKRQRGGK